jgi:hypothetical protein
MAHFFVALRKIMLTVQHRTSRIILLARLELHSFLKFLRPISNVLGCGGFKLLYHTNK